MAKKIAKKKLCDVKKSELDDIKKIVKPAKYVCEKCIRVAAKEKNLCRPVKLKEK